MDLEIQACPAETQEEDTEATLRDKDLAIQGLDLLGLIPEADPVILTQDQIRLCRRS